MEDQFYLQDKRSYVGNDMLFWAKDGCGYTTDLSKAHVFTKEEAAAHHRSRHTDVPWPKKYIDERTRPAVDFQYTNIKQALKGTGIRLEKEKRPRMAPINCSYCGKFISRQAARDVDCPHCGGDNRP